jgi:putative Mn2+ efflux pump MntP
VIESLLLAFALSADAFAIALGIGTAYRGTPARFRVSAVFGGFQFLFAFGGWQAGATILPIIAPWDRYVAAAALVFIAGKMLWESMEHDKATEPRRTDPTMGWTLIALGVADSIDALAAGVSLEKLPGIPIVTCIIIGAVTFAISWIAMFLASRIADSVGPWAERGGALVLTGIAAKIALF